MSNLPRIPTVDLPLDTPDGPAEAFSTAVATTVMGLIAGARATTGGSRWTRDRSSAFPAAFAVFRGSRYGDPGNNSALELPPPTCT